MSTEHSTDSNARNEAPNPGRGLVWGLLGVAGAGLVLLAAALVTGRLPAETWPLPALASAGFDAATLACTGALLCGLALAVSSLRSHARALARRAPDGPPIEELLDARLAEFQGTNAQLQSLQHSLQSMQGALLALEQKLDAVRLETRTGSSKDAMFRLAASLDQLGARSDQRLADTRDAIELSLQDVRARIEQAREALEQRFQETIRSIGTLSAEETLAESYDGSFGAPVRLPQDDRALGERSFREDLPRAGEVCVELERDANPRVDLSVLERMSSDARVSATPPAPTPAERAVPAPVPRPIQLNPTPTPKQPLPPLPTPSPAPRQDPTRRSGHDRPR